MCLYDVCMHVCVYVCMLTEGRNNITGHVQAHIHILNKDHTHST